MQFTIQPQHKMKTKNMTIVLSRISIPLFLIPLALCVFAFSPAAKAEQPIVGLWVVTYTSNNHNNPPFQTYQQWHSDGLEIESPSFSLGQCQGTWKQISERGVKLFHVGWTIGDPPGTVRFELTEPNTVVSTGRNSFDGTYDQKFFDASGNLVFEDTGTVHATRLSVN
jgi:hypothetical protein